MIKLLNILKEITVNKPGDPNWQKVYDYIENGSKGNLDLSNTDIKRLPSSLKKVGGDLDLYNTPITSLPDGLTVGGYLDLRNTPLSQTHTKEQIRQMAPGIKGNIYM